MKLVEILQERLSSVLYRTVPIYVMVRTLKDDKMFLSPIFNAHSQDVKFQRGKFFFLSTSRVKYTNFTKYLIEDVKDVVTIILDGTKLSQRYKGVPVRYYSGDFAKIDRNTSDEMEDRIISDKSYIPNALSYIKELHVFVQRGPAEIHELDRYAKSRKVPIYYYDDISSFKLLNKSKATTEIPKSSRYIETPAKEGIPVEESLLFKLWNLWIGKVDSSNKEELKLLTVVDDQQFIKNVLYLHHLFEDEAISEFEDNPVYKKRLEKFIREMKRNGKKTIPSFIKLIGLKFRENK